MYQRNTSSSPMVYRKFLESVVDGLVGTFQMPRSQRNRVLPVEVPLQPPPPPDHLIHHVGHRIKVHPDGKANLATQGVVGRKSDIIANVVMWHYVL